MCFAVCGLWFAVCDWLCLNRVWSPRVSGQRSAWPLFATSKTRICSVRALAAAKNRGTVGFTLHAVLASDRVPQVRSTHQSVLSVSGFYRMSVRGTCSFNCRLLRCASCLSIEWGGSNTLLALEDQAMNCHAATKFPSHLTSIKQHARGWLCQLPCFTIVIPTRGCVT